MAVCLEIMWSSCAWAYNFPLFSYGQLGKGVVAFIRATLGFEQEIMRQGLLKIISVKTLKLHNLTFSQRLNDSSKLRIAPTTTRIVRKVMLTLRMPTTRGYLHRGPNLRSVRQWRSS